MKNWTLDHPRLWLAVMIAVLCSMLPLAWLQYRWLGEVSEAERDRRRAHLESSLTRFVQELDGDLGRIFRGLLAGPGVRAGTDIDEIAARYARLADSGLTHGLVKEMYVSRGGADGLEKLFRLDAAAGRFLPVGWPAELEPLRARLQALQPGLGPGFPPNLLPADGLVPLMVAARWQLPEPGHGRGFRGGEGSGPVLAGWTMVQLDAQRLTKELLPSLAQRYFPEAEGYRVRIVSERDPARILYDTDPSLPANFFASPDAAAPLLDLRMASMPGMAGLRGMMGPGFRRRFQEPPLPQSFAAPGMAAPWRLLVKHRAGSLEATVQQTRRRNFGLSLLILSLMAASLVVLLISTRRAQRLARLQMEFVAGVSHELRTPLSVICSAGDNLADGVVAGEMQTRRYGALIRAEGRRLSRMVEQILGFAGIQSGRSRYDLQPVEIGEIVAKALAACEPELGASGCVLKSSLAPNLPPALADKVSLTHALRNLIENAITHGGEGKWIGVGAQLSGAGKEIEITVADHGRGIEPRDLPHLFEPFYRGRRSVEDQTRGFGLGLALAKRIVEAHSGTLTVESAPGQGTRFTARIPAAAAGQSETGGAAGEEQGEPTNSAG